jgi:hypothetical protein
MPQSSPVARQRLLTRYRDRRRRVREVIAMDGACATLLLVDRDASSGADWRLLAQLAADEPPENASLVCIDYLTRLEREPLACRRLMPADLERDLADAALGYDPGEDAAAPAHPAIHETPAARVVSASHDPDPAPPRFELRPQATARDAAQLRWWRCDARGPLRPVSLRDAIAALESYEPIRSLTLAATGRGQACRAPEGSGASVTVLRAELKRVLASPIVLNRGLREAVLERVERGDLSMSEIATRCGRVKHDSNGNESGETSWLGRRLGLLPEGGKSSPTPWIHSDVLALIARSGLGVPPREVEL